MELFEQIKDVVNTQNQAIMSGIELGRNESEASIKELETINFNLLEALKGLVDRLEHLKWADAVFESVLEQRIVEAKQAIKQAEE